ncbi:LysM peptidoglycan-binding domain-containing protein [Promicromonospora aerolata]|uniref:LysM peptidoglycan-binding domain-containing protein n=1 Tax=Promicromonospora aerolata TaxID=195749 RepID=A0ABW4VC18_9MICO
MSNHALTHAPSAYATKNRQPDRRGTAPATEPTSPRGSSEHAVRAGAARGGLTGLLVLAATLVGATGVLAARTWQVGTGLGTALFPIEDIVELAAVAGGTLVAGWTGLHALIALACVVAGRRGRRWAAGERAVARHAPAVVRRLARAAAGAGLGLALAAPTAMALPDRGPGVIASADGGPAVVLDLGWQPTDVASAQDSARDGAPGSAASRPRPAPERSALVNRGLRAGTVREPLVVVEPGDTLWGIAAHHLADEQAGADPSDAEVAAAVTRWHDANREALGTNPDLIRPGTVLHRP